MQKHGSSIPHCLFNLLGYQTNVQRSSSTCINRTTANDGWLTGFLANTNGPRRTIRRKKEKENSIIFYYPKTEIAKEMAVNEVIEWVSNLNE